MKLAEIAPLFAILRNPDDPAFNTALAKLTAITPQQLNAADLPGFLAELQTTIAKLQAEKEHTAQQLDKLRTQAAALQSYNQSKQGER